MECKIRPIKYKLPNGEYYNSTVGLEKNESGFLILSSYYNSNKFTEDTLDILFKEFSEIFKKYIKENGGFELNYSYINNIIDVIGPNYFSALKDFCGVEMSRRFISQDKLEKMIDSGIFDIEGPFTEIIYVNKI